MPNEAQPDAASNELSDVPLVVEDLLTELDDLLSPAMSMGPG